MTSRSVVRFGLIAGWCVTSVLGQRGGPAAPVPTHANVDYAPAEPATSNGHKLDLYIPPVPARSRS